MEFEDDFKKIFLQHFSLMCIKYNIHSDCESDKEHESLLSAMMNRSSCKTSDMSLSQQRCLKPDVHVGNTVYQRVTK